MTTSTRTQPWIQGEIDRLIDLRSETHDPVLQNEYTLQIRELSAEWDAIENQPSTERLHRGPRTELLKSEFRTIEDMRKVVATISSTASSLLAVGYQVGSTETGYWAPGDLDLLTAVGQRVLDLNHHWGEVQRLTNEIDGMMPVIRTIDPQ